MKGATALPLARISRPPNTVSRIRSGSSQYFLRARAKAKSSMMNDIGWPCSELVADGFGLGARGRTPVPVARQRLVIAKGQELTAEQARNCGDRRYDDKEHQSQDERIDDLVQQEAEAEPQPVQGSQKRRPEQSETGE